MAFSFSRNSLPIGVDYFPGGVNSSGLFESYCFVVFNEYSSAVSICSVLFFEFAAFSCFELSMDRDVHASVVVFRINVLHGGHDQ